MAAAVPEKAPEKQRIRIRLKAYDSKVIDQSAKQIIDTAIRTGAGNRLDSPALIADGNHARADSYVSLAVVATAVVVAIGIPVADPLIGLAITTVILKITWDSWRTVRGHSH